MKRLVLILLMVSVVLLSACENFQPPKAVMTVDKTEITGFEIPVTVIASSVGGDMGARYAYLFSRFKIKYSYGKTEIMALGEDEFILLGNKSHKSKVDFSDLVGETAPEKILGEEYDLVFVLAPRELSPQEYKNLENNITQRRYEDIKYPFDSKTIHLIK